MGRFTGVLLATDYDDTLYDRNFAISRENRQAIEVFIAEGGKFTVSTGRPYPNFAIQMERENVPVNAPVILSNGASIYDFATDQVLWEKLLPEEAADHLRQVCARFPKVGFEAYCGNDVYTFRANAVTEHHLTRCHLSGRPRTLNTMPLPWLKVILQDEDTEELRRVQSYLLTQWHDLYEVTFSNHYLLEMTARGANKGNAVLWLADYLGIQRDNIYCIGNGLNDLPMLEVSAIPYAPANCYKEVRDWGAEILTSCDESCIARLVEQLDTRYAASH